MPSLRTCSYRGMPMVHVLITNPNSVRNNHTPNWPLSFSFILTWRLSPTTSTLRVRRATHRVTPPLQWCFPLIIIVYTPIKHTLHCEKNNVWRALFLLKTVGIESVSADRNYFIYLVIYHYIVYMIISYGKPPIEAQVQVTYHYTQH